MGQFKCSDCETEFSAPLCCGEEMASAGSNYVCENCGKVMDEISASVADVNCCE
jgi:tRNA(Ile2) C34 agmatinyltransferase TiaS